ncbi:MAG: hypothetical protein AAFR54_10595 [Planctomycetota bacterium]
MFDLDPNQDPAATPEEEADAARRSSLEEVLQAGAESLLDSLDETDGGAMNFDVLETVVSRTGTDLAGGALDTWSSGDGDPVADEREGGDGIGATELEQLVAILESDGAVPSLMEPTASHLESASILMHEVHRSGASDPERYGRRLEERLRGIEPARVTELLWTACEDTARSLEAHEFDLWMRAFCPLLRRAVPYLVDRLAQVAAASDARVRETLWPHVVDEFLLGLKTRSREVDPRALDIDAESLERAVPRLLGLSSLGGALLQPGTFRVDAEFARPVALRLMESAAHEKFGPLVLAAFREAMPYDFGARSCVLAQRRYDASLGWILTQQLRSPRAALVGDAQRSTAWVLARGIAELEPERRQESWVPDAIRWLGERDMALDAPEQREALAALLNRVLGERRGLRRSWCADCRKAASRALQNQSLE